MHTARSRTQVSVHVFVFVLFLRAFSPQSFAQVRSANVQVEEGVEDDREKVVEQIKEEERRPLGQCVDHFDKVGASSCRPGLCRQPSGCMHASISGNE